MPPLWFWLLLVTVFVGAVAVQVLPALWTGDAPEPWWIVEQRRRQRDGTAYPDAPETQDRDA